MTTNPPSPSFSSSSSSFSRKLHQYVLTLCGGAGAGDHQQNNHHEQEFIGDDATWSGLEYEVISDDDDDDDINDFDYDDVHDEEKQFSAACSIGSGRGSSNSSGLPMLRELPSFGTTPYNYRSTSNGRGKIRKNTRAMNDLEEEEQVIKTRPTIADSKTFGDMQRLYHRRSSSSSSSSSSNIPSSAVVRV